MQDTLCAHINLDMCANAYTFSYCTKLMFPVKYTTYTNELCSSLLMYTLH